MITQIKVGLVPSGKYLATANTAGTQYSLERDTLEAAVGALTISLVNDGIFVQSVNHVEY